MDPTSRDVKLKWNPQQDNLNMVINIDFVWDLQKQRMVWEQELYNQFKYQTPKQFYHVFATDVSIMALK